MEQTPETPTAPVPPGAWQDDVWLKEFLHTRDVPCPGCGYNLRGLASSRCPECGQMLRLSVFLAEPYQTAWVLLLTFTAACAGMGCFYIPAVVRAGWPPGPQRNFLGLSILIQFAMIPIVPVVLLTRKRILCLPRKKQWALALSAMLILLISMALVYAGIR